jgi:hypothetical protein
VAVFTSLKKFPGLHKQKFHSNTSRDGQHQGIMLHGLGAHTRTSTASDKNDLVRDGVQYLCDDF